MINVFLAMLVLVAVPFLASSDVEGGNETDNADEAAIRQLLDQQGTALKEKDIETLSRIWAADYTFVNPSGQVVTKDQRLKVLGSGDTRIDSLSRDEIDIRIYGNAAVVLSRTTAKGRVAGKDVNNQFRATTVLVKQNGSWLIVSHQDNIIPARS